MCTNFIDPEAILYGNEQWTQLEEKWGEPVDLETDDDPPTSLRPVFSSLDLVKTTFDSSCLLNKVRRKVGRRLSKNGVLDYKNFLKDLKSASPPKNFYSVNKQIISALSVEEICKKIDDIFKSVEKLCSATSTIRKKGFPDVIGCSISVGDLSFDDTPSQDLTNEENVEEYIDEAFEHFEDLSKMSIDDDASKESVTTLVRKFSSILSSSAVSCNPRRRRERSTKFQELAEFWQNQAFRESAKK